MYCTNYMDIVHVASELAPIAKVGGLGDVLFGLSKALVKKGHCVCVILPKYDLLKTDGLQKLEIKQKDFIVEEGGQKIAVTLWSARFEGIDLVLIEDHHPKHYFSRGKIYSEEDDVNRFLFLSKAASLYIEQNKPDVVHLHDWPTAACTLFLKGKVKTVYTIHNLEYQGICAPDHCASLSLPYDPQYLSDPNELEACNLMRGAIYAADVLTTVSPSYAQEMLTPEFGCSLESDLLAHKKHLKGILNGIDTDYWNPQTDPLLTKTYSKETVSEGKKTNKQEVQKRFHLKPDKPLVVSITRLASQKGPDLIEYGIQKTLELGGQFVLLGSAADPDTQAQFEALRSLEGVVIHLEYDESLSHLLFAASDMLLMPSIFEPCGLTQMIAMRYGTVPLVRATGGLKDTVQEGINGFTFDIPDNKGVATVLEKGFAALANSEWATLIHNGMEADWSWGVSAEKYLEVYK